MRELAPRTVQAHRSKFRRRPSLLVAILFTLTAVVTGEPTLAAADVKRAQKELNKILKGHDFHARIRLGRGRFSVNPDGSFDKNEYAEWLAGGATFQPGEKGTRAGIDAKEKKGTMIVVLCGRTLGIMCTGNTRFPIEFGRPLTAADVTLESFLRATSRLVQFVDFDAPVEFDSQATLREVESKTDSPDSSPPVSVDSSGALVELIGAEVVPTDIQPGSTIRLVAHFEVAGLAPGQAVDLVENRQIFQGTDALLPNALSQTDTWSNGRHSTTIEIAIPSGTEAGAYRFTVGLDDGTNRQQKSAIFVVERAGDE